MDEEEATVTTRILLIECMICGEESEIEVPVEVSEALGQSVLNVCIPCSQKTPEELAKEEWVWRWMRVKP